MKNNPTPEQKRAMMISKVSEDMTYIDIVAGEFADRYGGEKKDHLLHSILFSIGSDIRDLDKTIQAIDNK